MKIDLNETIVDHENKEEITAPIHKYHRYSTLLVCFGIAPLIAEEAIPLKTTFGKGSYQIIAIKHIIKKTKSTWDIEFDGKLEYPNLTTMTYGIVGSKRCGN